MLPDAADLLRPALAGYRAAGALLALFACAAALLYFAAGARSSLTRAPPDAPVGHAAGAPAGSASAKSMEAEVAGLETRLARGGGTAEDWKLLAEGYEFLGRSDDAQRARSRITRPGGAGPDQMNTAALVAAAGALDPRPPGAITSRPTAARTTPLSDAATVTASVSELEQQVQQRPRDGDAWLALAELHRARHEYAAARDALTKVLALGAMTAQSWADYADVLASLAGGSFEGAPSAAIDRALALDPSNLKALWLKASAAHEERHFTEALGWWGKLRAALPAGSPDATIIESNIAEDSQLAAAASAGAAAPAQTAPGADISGTVALDGRLAGRVERNATLFIYAKAADSAGPPVAVLRTTAGAWPVSFRLDDSMAMIPSRRLSQFDRVVVEARISRSGSATPGRGDLYVTSPVLRVGGGAKVALVINREIG